MGGTRCPRPLTPAPPHRTLPVDPESLGSRALTALPREVRLVSGRSSSWPVSGFPGGRAQGPSPRTGLIPAPPPAEAPDGQGQGPQAAREPRRVGKERRGPAEVRGGTWRAAGGPGGRAQLPSPLNPTSARRGRRRSRHQPTAAQNPGTGRGGRVWTVVGPWAPHDGLPAPTLSTPEGDPSSRRQRDLNPEPEPEPDEPDGGFRKVRKPTVT